MPVAEYLEAVVLGVIQGVAEFLPISSSGHLVICTDIIKSFTGEEFDPEASLQMNVALHAGTLLSIVVVYRNDIVKLVRRPRDWMPIIIATLPLVFVALTPLKDWFETQASSFVAGLCLLITATLLFLSSRFSSKPQELSEEVEESESKISFVKAFTIGLFQSLALLPGISRSGSTITGAMFLNVHRQDAARFSFLIAIPAISGATVLMLKDYFTDGAESSYSAGALLVGAAVSFLVGLISLRWLLAIISRGKLHYFGWYCALAGMLTIVWKLFG